MTNLHADLEEPTPGGLPIPNRALAIGAHPDDVEFGAGGTIARWTAAGCRVTLLVITDGSKGTWDPTADPGALVVARRREAERAADILGAAGIQFMDQVDGELEATAELRKAIALTIRSFRPDVVLTHDPWQRYQLHPDHRAAGWLVADSVVAARDPLFFPEQLRDGLEPHRPRALLLWSPDEPNHWEDITGAIGTKVSALLCHSSQGQTTMGNAQEGGELQAAFEGRITDWAARSGAPAGLEAAEQFRRLTP